jgi:hypothetical protein
MIGPHFVGSVGVGASGALVSAEGDSAGSVSASAGVVTLSHANAVSACVKEAPRGRVGPRNGVHLLRLVMGAGSIARLPHVVDGAGAGSASLRYVRPVSGVHPRIAVISPLARALVVAVGITAAAPALAQAAPPDAGAQPARQDEGELEEVRQLYGEGKAKFDTYDYAGAIDLWTKAYAKLDPVEGNREIRNNLVYNIATAQEKAFEINGQVTHLRQAKGLLQRYLDEYKALYEPTPEARAEVAKVEARIAEIDARIDGAGAGGASQPTPPIAEERPPSPRDIKREQDRRVKEILREDPEVSGDYRAGKGMVTGGAVGLAVGGTFALGALSVWSATSPGTTGRTTVITIASLGGALAIGGAVLLGIGVPKRNRAIRRAREKASGLEGRVFFTPTLSLETAGLQVGGRF